MTEIWKEIPGYNGRYKVSSLGRVANDKGKLLKVDINQKGYARVQLTKDGKKSNIKVHRLVAEAVELFPKSQNGAQDAPGAQKSPAGEWQPNLQPLDDDAPF